MQYADKNYAGAAATFRSIVKETPTNRDAWGSLAWSLNKLGQYAEAGDAFVRSVDGTDGIMSAYGYYNAASNYAQAKKNDDAVAMLKKSFDLGFPNPSAIETDPSFASLKDDPRVKQLVAAR
jgi:tetratricopeptide (TPR) repeat protein